MVLEPSPMASATFSTVEEVVWLAVKHYDIS